MATCMLFVRRKIYRCIHRLCLFNIAFFVWIFFVFSLFFLMVTYISFALYMDDDERARDKYVREMNCEAASIADHFRNTLALLLFLS